MDLSELTEFTELDPERVDGVEHPANGATWLLQKSAGGGGGSAAAVTYRILVAE